MNRRGGMREDGSPSSSEVGGNVTRKQVFAAEFLVSRKIPATCGHGRDECGGVSAAATVQTPGEALLDFTQTSGVKCSYDAAGNG